MMSYGLVEVRCCCRHRDGFRPRGICNARNHIHINSRTQSHKSTQGNAYINMQLHAAFRHMLIHIYLSECVAHIVYCIYRLCKNWVERTVRIGYRREMSTALQCCICSVRGNAQWCLAWSADGVSKVCICAMFILYGLHQSCVASSIDEVHTGKLTPQTHFSVHCIGEIFSIYAMQELWV